MLDMTTTRPINRRVSARGRKAVALAQQDPLVQLMSSLTADLVKSTHSQALKARYYWAAEDAASLAFATPCPHLFFPILLAEKVEAARAWVQRQEAIRHRAWQAPEPSDADFSGAE